MKPLKQCKKIDCSYLSKTNLRTYNELYIVKIHEFQCNLGRTQPKNIFKCPHFDHIKQLAPNEY